MLTDSNAEVLLFITAYADENDGDGPTLETIAERFGYSGAAVSKHHVDRLERLGLVTRDDAYPYTLRVAK